MEKEGIIFVIRPQSPLNIGRLEKDPENVQRVYDRGRADAERQLQELLRWLKNSESTC